jgi:Peptide-N-glycosidase F, C terminal
VQPVAAAPDASLVAQAGSPAAAPPATRPDAGASPASAGAPSAPQLDAGTPATPPTTGTGEPDAAAQPALDAAQDAGEVVNLPNQPGTFKLFDQIPQFGMYATTEPNNYTPPDGVLMWSFGTWFVASLSPEQKAQIGADLKARITYHAQCDNYDRIGGMFFILMPRGQAPTTDTPRTELARFITPFSSYRRGELATYVFDDADISVYAAAFADPAQDVWIGIGGGSNPYDGDPCTDTNMPADFKAIGYKYSLEFVSSEPLTAKPGVVQRAFYDTSAEELPIMGAVQLPGDAPLQGALSVIVSGHGSESGGAEYANTMDTLSVNGMDVGQFGTSVDCAKYERFSPEGNPGIFRSNTGGNPRNWCPGALVAPHVFPVTLDPGDNTVVLTIEPDRLPSGSYYATSITFVAQ